MDNQESVGLTRRETLKRGAKLGGAVLWMTPVVQAVGMRPAFAQTTSPPNENCEVIYAVKIAAEGCEDIWNQVPNPNNTAQCLNVPVETAGNPAQPGGCDRVTWDIDEDFVWTVTFDEGCQYGGGALKIKAGSDPCEDPSVNYDAVTRTLTVTKSPATSPAISHLEFVFCCSD